MTPTRLLHALLCLALAGCTQAVGEEMPAPQGLQAGAGRPAIASPGVYVMRHLQRADGPDPALSEEGRRNAARLADALAADPPQAIYVSTTRRARETAAPLAAALGLTVKEYDPADSAALVARVASEPGTVLIVGHSNTVPDIVERLGGIRPGPLAETEFGDIWHISGADKRVERKRLGE